MAVGSIISSCSTSTLLAQAQLPSVPLMADAAAAAAVGTVAGILLALIDGMMCMKWRESNGRYG